MKVAKTFLLAIIVTVFLTSPSSAQDFARGPDDKKESPNCIALTDQCGVCSDSSLRRPPKKNKEWGAPLEDKLSPYKCASEGKIIHGDTLSVENCIKLSDFCAVCKDGHFLFTKNNKKIDSDLYECATSPRHSQGEVN